MGMRRNNRGDTIIEVLLASVILSIVLAGAYSLSSRATRLNQSSYERTKASNLVQEQAELLRSVSVNDPAMWTTITALPTEPYYDCKPETADVSPDTSSGNHGNIFYLEGSSGSISLHVVTDINAVNDKVTEDLYHTWAARSATSTANFSDFYIYTCWEGIGDIGNQATGAVLRLETR